MDYEGHSRLTHLTQSPVSALSNSKAVKKKKKNFSNKDLRDRGLYGFSQTAQTMH